MRILFLCAALVFLASGVSGEALCTLDSVRVAVARQLDQPDAGNDNITKAETITAINRAVQKVCLDFPAFEVVDTITVSDGTMAYTLDSDFVSIAWCVDDGGVPVAGVHIFNNQIFFTPERNADDYYLAYYATATKLSTDTSTLVIRPSYREPVVVYACYIISMQRGRLADAQAYLGQYEALKPE